MRVLMIVDKQGTAIDRLAQITKNNNPHHDIRVLAVHPKRPDRTSLAIFEQELKSCDVIDFRYWKSAELLRSMYSINKPCVLTHYNPYDLGKSNWSNYNANIVVNNEQQMVMKHAARTIPLPVDVFYWDFTPTEQYKKNTRICMVANRIEAKKGILPVAMACKQLGYKMDLVGNISDPAYFEEVMRSDAVEFHQNIADLQLKAIYSRAAIHVCNSVDNFETGTMPMLEAMSAGVPVMTRRVGHAPDLFDGKNMEMRIGDVHDVAQITEILKSLMDDEQLRLDMREAAWQTVKNRNVEVYARTYSKIYWEILGPQPLVSVIIPTCDRTVVFAKALESAIADPYPKKEIVVVDDGEEPDTASFLLSLKEMMRKNDDIPSVTIKYFSTALYEKSTGEYRKTYGLGHARNKAILEAEGKYIFFMDERMHIELGTICRFVEVAEKNTKDVWYWGVKDGAKKGFVENLSFVTRSTILRIGGFSEQITQYGGMTQEVRKRAEKNGITLSMVPDAQATSIIKSSGKRNKKRDVVKSKIQCYKLNE